MRTNGAAWRPNVPLTVLLWRSDYIAVRNELLAEPRTHSLLQHYARMMGADQAHPMSERDAIRLHKTVHLALEARDRELVGFLLDVLALIADDLAARSAR